MEWDSNPEPDIAGYRIYYRRATETFDDVVPAQVGPSSDATAMATLSGLAGETTYFAVVTAFNAAGLESAPSNELTFETGPNPASMQFTGARTDPDTEPVEIAISGKQGEKIDVYVSDDLEDWTLLTTVDSPTGALVISDPEASGKSRRFYRLATSELHLDDWMVLRGLEGTGPLDDPDNDGISNALAFVSGSDLLTNPFDVIPTMNLSEYTVNGQTGQYLTYSYTLRQGTRGVTLFAEYSDDLVNWFDASASTVEVSSLLSGDGTRSITIRETTPYSDIPSGRRYYRTRFYLE